MTDREVMQQALEALETCGEDEWHSEDDFGMVQTYDEDKVAKAITALKAALDQQAEPVAWNKSIRDSVDSLLEQAGYQPDSSARHQLAMMNFDATPPQRQWVGLTDKDFLEACQIAERGNYLLALQRIQIKLKERNT